MRVWRAAISTWAVHDIAAAQPTDILILYGLLYGVICLFVSILLAVVRLLIVLPTPLLVNIAAPMSRGQNNRQGLRMTQSYQAKHTFNYIFRPNLCR